MSLVNLGWGLPVSVGERGGERERERLLFGDWGDFLLVVGI